MLHGIIIEGGINSKQSSHYCTKPHQIQQHFGLNRTFFRLHYTNLYTNGKCTTAQFYSLNNKFGNAVMLVVMVGDAGCRGLSHRCWFQTVPGWLAQISSSFLCVSCVLCHPCEVSLLPSPPCRSLREWSGWLKWEATGFSSFFVRMSDRWPFIQMLHGILK